MADKIASDSIGLIHQLISTIDSLFNELPDNINNSLLCYPVNDINIKNIIEWTKNNIYDVLQEIESVEKAYVDKDGELGFYIIKKPFKSKSFIVNLEDEFRIKNEVVYIPNNATSKSQTYTASDFKDLVVFELSLDEFISTDSDTINEIAESLWLYCKDDMPEEVLRKLGIEFFKRKA